uniref:Wall-associated receptor kinase galacturonan-binding domain-containing protein n=1 Tax=Aegilops tauschii subsp. strangulata TaxID=200361 RepID=A0A452XKC8_AEGTS
FMGNPGAFHRSITLQSLTVFSLIAVFAADHAQGGDDGCTPFSCGHLRDILPPFRQRGDPLECGVEAYELGCTTSKATIHINTGTYYVTAINYTGFYFWVTDPNFNTGSSCPLPLWNHVPYLVHDGIFDSDSPAFYDLSIQSNYRACFANCSRAVTNKSAYNYFKEQISDASIVSWTRAFFWSEMHFYQCVTYKSYNPYYTTQSILVVIAILSSIAIPKFLFDAYGFI